MPAFNELLVALHTIKGNPDVRRALAAHAPQPAAPAVGSASPITLTTPTATPAGPRAQVCAPVTPGSGAMNKAGLSGKKNRQDNGTNIAILYQHNSGLVST